MRPTDAAAWYATLTCLYMSLKMLVTSWSVAHCLLACAAAVHVRRQVHSGRSCSTDVPKQMRTANHSGRRPQMHTSWRAQL